MFILLMTVFIYIGLIIIIIIANKKSKLKDIILLLSIILLLLDIVYFTFTNIIFNERSIYRYSSIIGDRAFEGDFITGLILFITSVFLIIDYKTWKRNIMVGIMFLGFNYLLILRSRSSLLATTVGVITLIILTYFLKIRIFRTDNTKKLSILSIAWQNNIYLTKLNNKIGVLVLTLMLSVTFSLFYPFNQQTDRKELGETVASIINNNFHSNNIRLLFWEVSLKMFTDNPISGIGYGKWSGLFPKYRGEIFNDENVNTNSSIYAHNDYLELMAEFGIWGILYSVFICFGIFRLWKKSLKEIDFIPYLIVAIGFAVTSFFNFTKDNLAAMSLFIVALGVGYSSNYQLSIINYQFFKNNKVILKRLMLIAAFILLSMGVWLKIMSYLNEREYLKAMQLKAQGKYIEMLEKLEEVSGFYYPVDMNKMPVDYYMGVGYFELKQYDKALNKFRSARKLMAYYPTIMNNEASALYMTGNIKEAEERYLEIKSIFPNYIEPQINLLSLYFNTKNYYKAKELAIEIRSKDINSNYINNYKIYLEIEKCFLKFSKSTQL